MRISFTGHRPEKLPYYGEDDPMCLDLKNRLAEEIEKLIESGADEFYNGMARGVDIWCAEAVLKLKSKYPQIKLYAVIPCPEQDVKWREADRIRYREVLGKCEKTYTACDHYDRGCMRKRDYMLVEFADIVVAVFDGSPGGTKITVDYAQKKHKKIITLLP